MYKPKSALLGALDNVHAHDHLCLIYETPEEQFAAVIPYMRLGLEKGERCLYIADDNTAESVLSAMREGGIDVEVHLKSGALVIASKREAYLKDGYFDPDKMIAFLKESTQEAVNSGFSALRITGEMTWALGDETGVDRLIEYEAKLNYCLPEIPAHAICQYSAKRFKPEIILDVIKTHPIVIYGNTVCSNFYFVPPNEFLNPGEPSHEVKRLLNEILSRATTESLFRSITEHANDAIICLKHPDTISLWNKKAEALFGYSSSEALGKNLHELIVPERYRDGAHAGLSRFFETGEGEMVGKVVELFALKRDGSEFPIELSISAMIVGDEWQSTGIVRDITERKAAEAKIREHVNTLERFMKATVARESRIRELTEEIERLKGMLVKA